MHPLVWLSSRDVPLSLDYKLPRPEAILILFLLSCSKYIKAAQAMGINEKPFVILALEEQTFVPSNSAWDHNNKVNSNLNFMQRTMTTSRYYLFLLHQALRHKRPTSKS